jgi:hypothetical protein
VKLGDYAKNENRLARLIGNLHPQFRPGFKRVVQIAEDLAGGLCRLYLNGGDVWKLDPVIMLGRLPAVTDAEKIFGHALASCGLMPRGNN